MFFKGWTVKQILISPYRGILINNKAEWSIDAHHNLGEFLENYAEWKSQCPKFTYNVIPFLSYSWNETIEKNRLVVTRAWGGAGRWKENGYGYKKATQGILVMKMFYILTLSMPNSSYWSIA